MRNFTVSDRLCRLLRDTGLPFRLDDFGVRALTDSERMEWCDLSREDEDLVEVRDWLRDGCLSVMFLLHNLAGLDARTESSSICSPNLLPLLLSSPPGSCMERLACISLTVPSCNRSDADAGARFRSCNDAFDVCLCSSSRAD